MVNFIVAGVGIPGRSMGWCHLHQLLSGSVARAKVTGIVEPFFLGKGKAEPGSGLFQDMVQKQQHVNPFSLSFSFSSLPPVTPGHPTVALISGRTSSCPGLFYEAIEHGVSHIYLEKPGAENVDELIKMQDLAKQKGVNVVMGFNKHVTPYVISHVLKRQQLIKEDPDLDLQSVYIHNNTFSTDTLPECFVRNSEGQIKNQAIHELALVVDHHQISVDNLSSITINPPYAIHDTELLTLDGITDFTRVAVQLETTYGGSVTVCANRCSDDSTSEAKIYNTRTKEELHHSVCALYDEVKKEKEEKKEVLPTIDAPYLLTQWDDYVTLKQGLVSHIEEEKEGSPEGIANLNTGIEALKLAEVITEKVTQYLQQQGTSTIPGSHRIRCD